MVAEAALIAVADISTEGTDASVFFVLFQQEGGVVDVSLPDGREQRLADQHMVDGLPAALIAIGALSLTMQALSGGRDHHGKVLDATNPEGTSATELDYTAPLVMLACLGVAALILGFVLKAVDKKKGIGLELPNIKE